MKVSFLCTIISLFILYGCNDKPEPQPTNNQLSVYPNPAIDFFNIRLSNPSNDSYTLQVFGTNGKIIFDAGDNQTEFTYEIDISDEPKGTFEVILKKGDVKTIQRVIKI